MGIDHKNMSHLNAVAQFRLSNVYSISKLPCAPPVHHQALTAPTVASSVSQSRASRPSLAVASLQRNGPRWPTARLGATDQDVMQSIRAFQSLSHVDDEWMRRAEGYDGEMTGCWGGGWGDACDRQCVCDESLQLAVREIFPMRVLYESLDVL